MEKLPVQLVTEFFDDYSQSGIPNRASIARLTRLALSDDPLVAEAATTAIFASLVERLADSFEPDAARLYNQVFAQIIQICRSDERARALDSELTGFELAREDDLLARAETLRHARRLPLTVARNLKLVIVLSRVTLGADVAITSVIVEFAKLNFPSARIMLVGGRKTTELFGGDSRLQFEELNYRRGGQLIERLLAWVDLLAIVRRLTSGLNEDEYLIVDPDSRLTQLGLLPLTKTGDRGQGTGDRVQGSEFRSSASEPKTGELANYLFFPSREYGSGTTKSMAQLASDWLDEVFGVSETTLPRVSLNREDIEIARRRVAQLRGDRSRRLVAINLGVGENPLKRVGLGFETCLIERLCEQDLSIILDKGAGAGEAALVDRIVAKAIRAGRARAIELNEQSLLDPAAISSEANVLIWRGRIGILAALIGESDLYIGYDSAGQHIAAALGVGCIDVFAGHNSKRFVDRWKPTGRARCEAITVESNFVAGVELLVAKIGDALLEEKNENRL